MDVTPRKISINVDPVQGNTTTHFFEDIQTFVSDFVKDRNYTSYLDNQSIFITWYSDAPVSDGVSIGVNFTVIEGVDFAKELVVALRKDKHVIRGVTVGY